MSAREVPLPVQVPGEDVANPLCPPLPARGHVLNDRSAEFGGPLKHEGWTADVPGFGDLDLEEQIAELRKDTASEYFREFEEDPVIEVHCPRCVMRVLASAEGVCPDCEFDFMGPWPPSEPDGPERGL